MPIFQACSYPGCGKTCHGRFCPVHEQVHKTFIESRRKDGITRGSPIWWKKIRVRILKRDPVCRVCGLRPSTEVDHILARFAGGKNNPENLQGLCGRCHKRKTMKETGGLRGRRVVPEP